MNLKRWLALGALLIAPVAITAAANSSSTTSNQTLGSTQAIERQYQATPPVTAPTSIEPAYVAPSTQPAPYVPPVAPNGTYRNVDGNQVSRPYYSNTAPSGASARCGDRTYSFSQHRSGTCSHHGGVAEWL